MHRKQNWHVNSNNILFTTHGWQNQCRQVVGWQRMSAGRMNMRRETFYTSDRKSVGKEKLFGERPLPTGLSVTDMVGRERVSFCTKHTWTNICAQSNFIKKWLNHKIRGITTNVFATKNSSDYNKCVCNKLKIR